MLRLSTGCVNKLMGVNPFKTIFAACFIDVYSGSQPASADDVPNGTKLVTVYSDGVATGLSFEAAASDGVLEKDAGQTWSAAAILASGQAGWFRMREAGDPGTGASTTAARVDGSCGTAGADMILGSVNLVQNAPFVLPAASFTLPKTA